MTNPFLLFGGRSREVTNLPPQYEAAFRAWLRRNRVTDLDHPQSFYDYRGAFLAGVNRDGSDGHFPDTFKQHGHPTFSNESKYAVPGDPYAGSWDGETYIPPRRRYPVEQSNVLESLLAAELSLQRPKR